MKKKTAFISGITGMVGSHLLDYLIKNTNWEIHGLVRWRSSLEAELVTINILKIKLE